MTRFSEAKGRKVVSTSTADTVGRIASFVVDPEQHAVIAVQLRRSSGGDTLAWSAITAFGVDAVTVPSADAVTAADPAVAARADRKHRVLGKRVLTVAGDELGEVDDVEFDPTTGAITALLLDGGVRCTTRLVGIGSYAVVVRVAPPG